MRTLLILSLITLAGCDKALHFGAGSAISATVYEATGSRQLGCAAATVAGVAKEVIDPIPDPFDIAATIAGGCGPHMRTVQ